MKIMERYENLAEGDVHGYCIGLFLPKNIKPIDVFRIVNKYLEKSFPPLTYYHQMIPTVYAICSSVGFPLPAPIDQHEALVRETVREWFRCLDSEGMRGAASIVYDQLSFQRTIWNENYFSGPGLYTAIKWFGQLIDLGDLLDRGEHVLAVDPQAAKRLQISGLPNLGACSERDHEWAILHYGPHKESILNGGM